jgi:hypothetical protein
LSSLTETVTSELSAGRFTTSTIDDSLSAFNASVADFQKYAKGKMSSKSLAVGALVPIAAEVLSNLIQKYRAVAAERREAMIEDVKRQLSIVPFDSL